MQEAAPKGLSPLEPLQAGDPLHLAVRLPVRLGASPPSSYATGQEKDTEHRARDKLSFIAIHHIIPCSQCIVGKGGESMHRPPPPPFTAQRIEQAACH